MGSHPTPLTATLYAVSLPALGSLYRVLLVFGVDRARVVFSKISACRAMDTITGAALLGFGACLATE